MAPKAKPETRFVTEEKFNELKSSVDTLVDLMTRQAEKVDAIPLTPEALAQDKEVAKAGPKPFITPVNPEWEAIARDVIGAEKVERCELEYARGGGTLFTVVIKKDFSNAPDDYLNRHKEDRRSKEIGQEGIGGVENWCKLIAQNLKRSKSYIGNK